jgi:hypothetical protein
LRDMERVKMRSCDVMQSQGASAWIWVGPNQGRKTERGVLVKLPVSALLTAGSFLNPVFLFESC